MYKQIKSLHEEIGTPMFAMVVSHLLQKGIVLMKDVSDEDIGKLKENPSMSKDFVQQICLNTRRLANMVYENPIALIMYCMAVELFDVNTFVPFEEKVISKVVWTNQDIIDDFYDMYNKKPTEDEVAEIVDLIDFGQLENCSYGWDAIDEAIAKQKRRKTKCHINKRKEVLRMEAMNFQHVCAKCNFAYSELAIYQTYFEKQAKRFGLLKEFRENGII